MPGVLWVASRPAKIGVRVPGGDSSVKHRLCKALEGLAVFPHRKDALLVNSFQCLSMGELVFALRSASVSSVVVLTFGDKITDPGSPPWQRLHRAIRRHQDAKVHIAARDHAEMEVDEEDPGAIGPAPVASVTNNVYDVGATCRASTSTPNADWNFRQSGGQRGVDSGT